MLGFAACKDDPIEPDPIIIDDPDPIVTEECFDVIDLTNIIDVARSIIFINPTEGWLVGRATEDDTMSTLLHTDDGGLTWSVMNNDLRVNFWTSVSAPYIDFYNSNDGYMIGEHEYVTGGYGGNPLKYTTDKGQTWTEIADVAYGTWDVFGSNSTDAVFIGHTVYGYNSNSVLYRVSNTTHEITQIAELPISNEFYAKTELNLSEDGVINVPVSILSGDSYLYMARSADYGLSWTYTAIDLDWVYDMNFPTDNTGYIQGTDSDGNGYLYKTTDGGTTWTKKPLPVEFFNYHDFFDTQNGIGVSASKIYKTTDGAETWTEFTCISDSDHRPSRGLAAVSLDKWFAIGSRYDSDEDETYQEFYIYEEE